MLRILNAGLGLIGAPLALVATLGLGWRHWRREGDDPELTDSPSILMAGPPAEMTPALATVIRNGTATGHSINTILAELASTRPPLVPQPRPGQRGPQRRRPGSSHRPRHRGPCREPGRPRAGRAGARGVGTHPARTPAARDSSPASGSGRSTRSSTARSERSSRRRSASAGWRACRARRSRAMVAIGVGLAVIGARGHLHRHLGADERRGHARRRPRPGRDRDDRVRDGHEPAHVTGRVRRRHAQGVSAHAAEDDGPGPQHERGRRAAGDREACRHARTRPSCGAWRSACTARWRRSSHAGSRPSARRPAPRPARTTRCGSARRRAHRGPARVGGGDLAGGVSYGSGSVFSGSAMPDIGGMFDALGSVGSTPPSSARRAAAAAGSRAAAAPAAEAAPGRFSAHWRCLNFAAIVETDEFQQTRSRPPTRPTRSRPARSIQPAPAAWRRLAAARARRRRPPGPSVPAARRIDRPYQPRAAGIAPTSHAAAATGPSPRDRDSRARPTRAPCPSAWIRDASTR